MGEYGGQGSVWTQLYLEDLNSPQVPLMASRGLFQWFDNSSVCGGNFEGQLKTNSIVRSIVESVQFGNTTRGGAPTISARFSSGKRSMTPAMVKDCNQAPESRRSSFMPVMHRYQVDFSYDGDGFKLTPASAALSGRLGLP
jgi:hypothetical protein